MVMENELWPGGPRFKEDGRVFRVGADAVLLAHFISSARPKKKETAVDFCCGSGIIAALLALDNPDLRIDAVDFQRPAVLLATENFKTCGLSDRAVAIEGDIRRHREFLPGGAYDFVASNPPYYPGGKGKRAATAEIADARDDSSCTPGELCRAACYAARRGGSFYIVHKPGLLPGLFRALGENGFEPKRLRFVQHKSSSPPSIALIESRKGGGPSLNVEAPLILYDDDGSETTEAKAVYGR